MTFKTLFKTASDLKNEAAEHNFQGQSNLESNLTLFI
jgi:hypothetical protein